MRYDRAMIWTIEGATADDDRLLPLRIRRCFAPDAASCSEVFSTYPELRERLTERDGLLPISAELRFDEAWLTYRQHHLQLHPGFQRSLQAGINRDLVAVIRELHDAGARVGVAINQFHLSPLGTLCATTELDRWFGATYDRTRLDDLRAVGAVMHVRTLDVGHNEKAGLRCEFRWSADDQLKTFEIEELPQPAIIDALGAEAVYCRYLHAIRDTTRHGFVHVDGAISMYSRVEYERRWHASGDHHESKVWADAKVKIFRADAVGDCLIADAAWEALIRTFFRGNELVLEYLSGRSFREIYRTEFGIEHPFIAAQLRASGTV
jgi:hypothetical protein